MKKSNNKQRILDKEVERLQQMVVRREAKLSRAKTKLSQAEGRASKHRERKARKDAPVAETIGVPEGHPHGV